MELLEVSVRGVFVDKERSHPVVLLACSDEDGVLPIWIGGPEAIAIVHSLAGRSFERPLTHDLLKIAIDALGAKVDRVEITGIHADTYFARIVLKRDEDVFYLDARPSDSIALALRAEAPILVEQELFKKYRRDIDLGSDEDDEVRRRLRDIDPENFGDIDLSEES